MMGNASLTFMSSYLNQMCLLPQFWSLFQTKVVPFKQIEHKDPLILPSCFLLLLYNLHF